MSGLILTKAMDNLNTSPLDAIASKRKAIFLWWMSKGIVTKAMLFSTGLVSLLLLLMITLVLALPDSLSGIPAFVTLVIVLGLLFVHFANRRRMLSAYSAFLQINGIAEYLHSFSMKLKYNGYPMTVSYTDSFAPFTAATVITVDLLNAMPHIMLDNRRNDRVMSSMRTRYKTDQLISLEGNFNKFYDVYVPRGEHIDALSILSPDVMHALIAANPTFDVEIYDKEMVISAPGLILLESNKIQDMVSAVEALIDSIQHAQINFKNSSNKSKILESDANDTALRFGRIRFGINQFLAWVMLVLTFTALCCIAVASYTSQGLLSAVFSILVFGSVMTICGFLIRKMFKDV